MIRLSAEWNSKYYTSLSFFMMGDINVTREKRHANEQDEDEEQVWYITIKCFDHQKWSRLFIQQNKYAWDSDAQSWTNTRIIIGKFDADELLWPIITSRFPTWYARTYARWYLTICWCSNDRWWYVFMFMTIIMEKKKEIDDFCKSTIFVSWKVIGDVLNLCQTSRWAISIVFHGVHCGGMFSFESLMIAQMLSVLYWLKVTMLVNLLLLLYCWIELNQPIVSNRRRLI